MRVYLSITRRYSEIWPIGRVSGSNSDTVNNGRFKSELRAVDRQLNSSNGVDTRRVLRISNVKLAFICVFVARVCCQDVGPGSDFLDHRGRIVRCHLMAKVLEVARSKR